jgi:hypothetical protein
LAKKASSLKARSGAENRKSKIYLITFLTSGKRNRKNHGFGPGKYCAVTVKAARSTILAERFALAADALFRRLHLLSPGSKWCVPIQLDVAQPQRQHSRQSYSRQAAESLQGCDDRSREQLPHRGLPYLLNQRAAPQGFAALLSQLELYPKAYFGTLQAHFSRYRFREKRKLGKYSKKYRLSF